MRVLIVEDEVLVRTDLAQWLQEAGHAVEDAPNGRAGLDRMRREAPDVVLLDLRMLVMDGYAELAVTEAAMSDPMRI